MRRVIFWAGIAVGFVTAVLSSAFLSWMLAGATHGDKGFSGRFLVSLAIFIVAFAAAMFTRPRTIAAE